MNAETARMKDARMEMADRLYFRRRIGNAVGLVFATASTAFGLFWLAWILWTTLSKGIAAINLDLFTKMTPPPGETGGLLNAFVGSALICGLAMAIGAPIGIAAGTYPRRVREEEPPRRNDPLRQRHSAFRAVDRARHVHLHDRRAPDRPLSRPIRARSRSR